MKTAFYNHELPAAIRPAPPVRERWWRLFFDHSEDALLVCRPDGTIEEANPRAMHLLALAEDAVRPTLFDFLAPPSARVVADKLKLDSSRQETLTGLRLLVGQGGRTSPICCSRPWTAVFRWCNYGTPRAAGGWSPTRSGS